MHCFRKDSSCWIIVETSLCVIFLQAAYSNGSRYRFPWECFIWDVALLSRLVMKDAFVEAAHILPLVI